MRVINVQETGVFVCMCIAVGIGPSVVGFYFFYIEPNVEHEHSYNLFSLRLTRIGGPQQRDLVFYCSRDSGLGITLKIVFV